MSSHLYKKFETEYKAGQMEEMAQKAVPFFMQHLEDLADFVQAFCRSFGPQPLDLLCKLFILNRNMPFDMGEYMRSQSSFIEENLRQHSDSSALEHCSENRRDAVRDWIQNYAKQHRQEAILRQVYCFDRHAQSIVEPVRQALRGRGIEITE